MTFEEFMVNTSLPITDRELYICIRRHCYEIHKLEIFESDDIKSFIDERKCNTEAMAFWDICYRNMREKFR